MVYNLPFDDLIHDQVARENPLLNVLPTTDHIDRPQELFLCGDDGYSVCVSAVAPVPCREPATVDVSNGRLYMATSARPNAGLETLGVEFVPQPAYYAKQTRSGRDVRRWVSACGYDEMNVWPWHDCAIGRPCTFCGINSVQKKAGRNVDLLHALELRQEPNAE